MEKIAIVKVKESTRDYLMHTKIDRKLKSIDEAIWSFIKYEGEEDARN